MAGQCLADVEVQSLTKVFGSGQTRVEAIRGIDLQVAKGEFVSVMGPSGSGKSTLLHVIGGLETPTSGRVLIGGEDLSALDDDRLTLLRRRIGFVFQAFNLMGVLTAEENVALPLVLAGVDRADAHRRAVAVLEQAGLADRRKHLPGELSGGEQQRVTLARALVSEPLLVLADEPTGNLDTASADRVMAFLRRVVDERRQTVLMVTHEQRYADLADRVIRLRDGRVCDGQPPQGERQPRDHSPNQDGA